jgi:hypothetical protein
MKVSESSLAAAAAVVLLNKFLVCNFKVTWALFSEKFDFSTF